MAHITGGGVPKTLPRVLPENTVAQIDAKAWELPKLFQWLQKAGNVENQECTVHSNCGIGMVVIIAKEDADAITGILERTKAKPFTVWAQFVSATATNIKPKWLD